MLSQGISAICPNGKKLYVVSTYYHALISCVKQLVDNEQSDILVTSYIPDGQSLVGRINKSGLFDKTYFIGSVDEYKPRGRLDYIFNQHRKNAELIERQLPFSFMSYREINVFHDDIWVSHYLKDRRIDYRLIEDALDSFKTISQSCFSYMLPKNHIKSAVKNHFRIGYVFCGFDSCTVEVEVNDINGVEIASFARNKLREVSRKALFNALSENDKNILVQVFAKEIPDIQPDRSVLLLTQPLYIDGLVKTQREQIEIYRRLADDNILSGEKLIIKPHPRDSADYSRDIPEAIVLDKNMPLEILTYMVSREFSRVVSLSSSATTSIMAKKYIVYGGIINHDI